MERFVSSPAVDRHRESINNGTADGPLSGDFLAGFTFSRLVVVCRAETDLYLPHFTGSTFRGVFGRALKALVCVARHDDCGDCPLMTRCIYTNVFEVRAGGDLPLYKNVSHPPRPFILEPPVGGRLEAGCCFELGLISIGRTVEYAPWIIQALVQAGSMGLGRRKGLYRVVTVKDGLAGRVLYENERYLHHPLVASGRDLPLPVPVDQCTLRILTPMRLKVSGSMANSLPFDSLARHLLRRIALLGAFFCNQLLEIDFPHWIASAQTVALAREDLEWADWDRYSMRQHKTIHLGGLVGQVTYQGRLAAFAPLLSLGRLIHVGKGTSFGLGRYDIEPMKGPAAGNGRRKISTVSRATSA